MTVSKNIAGVGHGALVSAVFSDCLFARIENELAANCYVS